MSKRCRIARERQVIGTVEAHPRTRAMSARPVVRYLMVSEAQADPTDNRRQSRYERDVFAYRVEEQEATVFTVVSGSATDQDLLEHVRTVLADPRITTGARALVDFGKVTDFQITSGGLRDAAELFRRQPKFARTAFIGPSDLVYGMGRMYEMQRDATASNEIGVFRDLPSAKGWLERS